MSSRHHSSVNPMRPRPPLPTPSRTLTACKEPPRGADSHAPSATRRHTEAPAAHPHSASPKTIFGPCRCHHPSPSKRAPPGPNPHRPHRSIHTTPHSARPSAGASSRGKSHPRNHPGSRQTYRPPGRTPATPSLLPIKTSPAEQYLARPPLLGH